MNVAKGYKMTEIGVIPEDWEVKRIKDIAPLQRGFDLPVSTQETGEYPVVYSNGITSFHNSFTTKGPGVVTGRSGTLGKVHYVESDYWAHNTTLWVTNFLGNYPLYIYYLYSSLKLERFGSGSGVPTLNRNDVHDYYVAVPPLPEQRSIARVLSDTDELINALDKLIAKKRDIKKAVMQELLTGKTRLPGFSGEWEVKKLGDIAIFLKGRGLAKSELIPFGGEPCIHYGELFTQYPEKITEIISQTITSIPNACRSVSNDVLMPTSDVTPRGLAKASCLEIDGVILGGDILVIRSKQGTVDGTFLSYIIRYEENQVLQLVTGSTVYHLYASDMKEFIFSLPTLAEQQAIAQVLSDMDREIAALEQRRDKTKALKQGMMQELLTGRIRLH